jgi:phage shock protein C
MEYVMNKKLYRSRTNVMLGGVCAGLGDYFSIDPTFIRLFFVLLVFGNGIGFMLYLILWIVLPAEDQPQADIGQTVRLGSEEIADRARSIGDDIRTSIHNPHPKTGLIIGSGLIILGVYYFLRSLDISWLQWLNYDIVWPLIIIAAGVFLIIRRGQGEK